MFSILSVLALLSSQNASADMMAPATLDLICTAAGYPVVKVMSEPRGAAIHVGRTMFSLAGPLVAGTEGGDPYIQDVNNNAYNILISGADLTKAFDTQIAVQGSATAHVQLFAGQYFKKQVSYTAQCVGLISFR